MNDKENPSTDPDKKDAQPSADCACGCADNESGCACGSSKGCGKRFVVIVALLIALLVGYFAGTSVERARAAKLAENETLERTVLTVTDAQGNVDIAEYETSRKDLEAKLQLLESTLIAERSAGAELAKDNAQLKKALDQTKTDIEQLKKALRENEDIRPAYDKAMASLAAAQREINALKQAVSVQEKALGSADKKIVAQRQQIDTLKTQVDDLSGQLSESQRTINTLLRNRGAPHPGGAPLKYR